MDSQSTQTIKPYILQPENGNAPIVTKTIDGKETVIPPTSVEEKVQRRLELKVRSTLLIALPNEHQLKFNSYKDAKTLMQAIENRFGEIETLSLNDLFNNLKAYESEVKGTSSSTTNSHNVAFLSSSRTNSATRSVNTASTQGAADSSTTNIVMLTIRARRFLKNTERKLDMANKERIRFEKSKVECFNCHKRGHFVRKCRTPRNQDSKNKEPKRRTVPVEETTSNALVSYSSSSTNSELKRKLELATKEKDKVQLTVQNFENSSKNLSKLLDSRIMDKCKTGLGYNVVSPPYTGNFMPPKSDLVYPSLDDFVDESVSESVVKKPTVETNEPKNARKENGAPIIED
ncbi:putative ribonuclease H-like domain-containing protein [Tanacetum coccineum]